MKSKQTRGESNVLLLGIIVLAVLGVGFFLLKNNKMQLANTEAINTVADLDKASAQLDNVDVDGLGNEMSQFDADAKSF